MNNENEKKTEESVRHLNARITGLKARNSMLTKRVDELTAKNVKLADTIAELNEEISGFRVKLDMKRAKIDELSSKLASMNKKHWYKRIFG